MTKDGALHAASSKQELSRLAAVYLLTPDWTLAEDARVMSFTTAALQAGVTCVQYRNKQAEASLRKQQAQRLRQLTRAHSALLIVNDDAQLAAECEADGVHLGREDGAIATARALLPAGLIGVSCYDSWQRAQQAAHEGADYVAFGSVFRSLVKPNAVRAPLALLAAARQQGLHAVAIGGIEVTNIEAVAANGAHAAALISAVYRAADVAAVEKQVHQLINYFENGRRAFSKEGFYESQ